MSTKLVKSQLHAILQNRIGKKGEKGGSKGKKQKQQGQEGRRAAKKRRQQQQGEAASKEKQTAVLAANLRYFSKTTAASGKAADLVAQVRPVLGRCETI